MKKKWRVIIGVIVVVILGPVLFILGLLFLQIPYIRLKVNGHTIAVIKQPFIAPWTDGSADVYSGKEKLFSLWEDSYDRPEFIYPFADGKRFLCDYDYDVALLDFVVDFSGSKTNDSPAWSHYGQPGGDIERMATNVVFDTKGVIRLPTTQELLEVCNFLTSTNPTSMKAGYCLFPNPWTKQHLLLDLATNRTRDWPLVE